MGAPAGFGKVLVDEKERKEKIGARSGPPKIEEREREKRAGREKREASWTEYDIMILIIFNIHIQYRWRWWWIFGGQSVGRSVGWEEVDRRRLYTITSMACQCHRVHAYGATATALARRCGQRQHPQVPRRVPINIRCKYSLYMLCIILWHNLYLWKLILHCALIAISLELDSRNGGERTATVRGERWEGSYYILCVVGRCHCQRGFIFFHFQVEHLIGFLMYANWNFGAGKAMTASTTNKRNHK